MKKIMPWLILSNLIFVAVIISILFIKMEHREIQELPTQPPASTQADYDLEVEDSSQAKQVATDTILKAFDFTDSNDAIQRRRQSLEEFKKSMSLTPPFLGANTQGYAYAKLGQFNKGIEMCQQNLKKNPGYTEARYTLAWIYTMLRRYNDAITVCQESLKLDPSYLNSKYLLAWLYANQSQFDKALETVKQIKQKDPDSPRTYYGLGRIYSILQQHQDAIDSYKQAITLKTDYAPAYFYYGISLIELQEFPQALEKFNQAVFYDPYYEYAFILAGFINFRLEKYQEAGDALQRAVNLHPPTAAKPQQLAQTTFTADYSKIHYYLGLAYIKTGLFVQAQFSFEEAIKIKSDFTQAHYALALTYLLLDDTEKAIEQQKTLEKIDKGLADKLTPLLNN
ncbi:MAG: tetratricopeptide repeat protein [Planctomycetota bacterium]|jgi:tetratricopeptide (TPR) repeat protein